jgi:hypothetical protein
MKQNPGISIEAVVEALRADEKPPSWSESTLIARSWALADRQEIMMHQVRPHHQRQGALSLSAQVKY